MPRIGFAVRKLFFDTPKVMRAVDRAERQRLSRFGSFVRTRARSSIRKRKRASEPGQPPSGHTGVLRRYIFFAYEPEAKTVVIGPVPIHMKSVARGHFVSGVIPALLEHGGQGGTFEVQEPDGHWHRADLRSKRRIQGKPQRTRFYVIQARPYMRPAFDVEMEKLPALWADSVK